ncbi:tape measure protein [Arthrobacter phage Wollypog]|uniref:Tape measure protein n=1 Tax=Arthrobacter phage Wollypog TaxID=2790985 RepID=A0A7T3N3H3_9CAUD|nr:tail length tape measure protein [Arthrobacter phage Wollypog]QPX62569.1 tape measure protein [Arthrobacter phage Wollypog]
MAGGYNLGTATGRIEIDSSGVDKGFAVAKTAVSAFADSVNDQRARMEQYGKDMTRNAIIGAGGFAIAAKSAAGFEKQLSAIQAVSGATTSDMKTVAEAALEIGANSAFSASEAAMAFEELIKAGIPLEEALNGAAKATVDLAAAGEIALPRAAEISANAMNNFNKTGKDMPAIADAIAGAANASAISVEEFAQSLSQVGAVANLTGLSFEDTAVAIAEMGNAGIKGSDAGTSLKTMLMNLIPTMDNQIAKFEEMGLMTFSADKAMKAMSKSGIPAVGNSLQDVRRAVSDYLEETEGIKDDTKEMGKAVDDWLMKNGAMQNAFFKTNGEIKSLKDIQQVLQESTKNMTKEQKLNSLEVLFGADAIRGAAVMADNGAKGYNDLAAAMGKVGATDVANMRMDNLTGDIEALKGAWETLTIRLGTVFLPVIRQIVQGITKLVQFFADATDFGMEVMAKWLVFKTIGMGISGVVITLVSSFGPLLSVLLAVKTAFSFAEGAKAAFAALASGKGVVKAMSLLFTETIRGSILFRSAFKALEVVFMRFLGFGGVVKVFAGIAPAMAAGVGPMTIMMTTIKGLGAAFGTIGARILTLITGVNRVAGVFTLLGGPVGLAIRIILGLVTLGKILYGTWEPFRNLVDGIVAGLQVGFANAVKGVQDAIAGLIAGFSGAQTAGDGIQGTFAGIGAAIRPVIDWLVELYNGVVAQLVPAFNEMVGAITSSIGPALAALGNTITTTLWPAIQELGRVFVEQLWPALVQVAEALWPFIQAAGIVAGVIVGVLFFALVKVVEFLFGQFIPSLLRIAGPVIAFLIGAISNLISMIVMFITPLVQVASFIFGTLIPAFLQWASVVLGAVITAIQWVVQAIQDLIKWFQGIPAAVEQINSQVNGFFAAMVQGIVDAWNGLVGFIGNIFAAIGATISMWVNTWIQNFLAFVNFLRPIWEPILAIWQAVIGVFMAIFTGLGNFLTKLFTFVFGVIGLTISTFVAQWIAQWNAFWATIGAAVQVAVNWVVSIWTTFWAVVVAIWTGFVAMYNAAWNAFWAGLQAFLQPVIDWFNSTIGAWWNSMFSQSQGGSNAIADLWNGFWSGVQDLFNTAVAIIRGFVENWIRGMQNTINGGMSAIRGIIDGIWSGIRGIVQGAIGWLNDITGGGFDKMVGIVRTAIGMLPGIIQGKWNEVIGFLQGIPGRIQGVFAGAASWLSDIGRTIIDGLLGGLRAAAGNIESFFKGLTDMIPDWKGPYKRDKVLLKPAGQAIMQSLGDGFEDEIGNIYKMLDAMNVDIPLALSATLNPAIPSLEGSLAGYPVRTTNILKDPNSKLELKPSYNVAVRIGDKDITDIVDIRVEEKLDETAGLMETGVFE